MQLFHEVQSAQQEIKPSLLYQVLTNSASTSSALKALLLLFADFT